MLTDRVPERAHLVAEDAHPGVQGDTVSVLQRTVRTRHAASPGLLLCVSQNVRLEIGRLCELLVTSLLYKQLVYSLTVIASVSPRRDTHKACLQYVFLHEFLN